MAETSPISDFYDVQIAVVGVDGLTLKSSVESLTQRCREAESAENVQISDGKENHDKKNLGKFFHPIGENNYDTN